MVLLLRLLPYCCCDAARESHVGVSGVHGSAAWLCMAVSYLTCACGHVCMCACVRVCMWTGVHVFMCACVVVLAR
jgi:hypothetical protein